MNYPGYIVVAINYVNGERAVYKIGRNLLNLDAVKMIDSVFLPDSDTIQFFGCPMEDDEECWFRVPSTAYASVSWKWYSIEELKGQAEAKRDNRTAAQRHADEIRTMR
jgi:hypothetical protein